MHDINTFSNRSQNVGAFTDHGARNISYMWNVVSDTAYPSSAGTRLLSQLESGCLVENYNMPPSESAQLRFLVENIVLS